MNAVISVAQSVKTAVIAALTRRHRRIGQSLQGVGQRSQQKQVILYKFNFTFSVVSITVVLLVSFTLTEFVVQPSYSFQQMMTLR